MDDEEDQDPFDQHDPESLHRMGSSSSMLSPRGSSMSLAGSSSRRNHLDTPESPAGENDHGCGDNDDEHGQGSVLWRIKESLRLDVGTG